MDAYAKCMHGGSYTHPSTHAAAALLTELYRPPPRKPA